MDLPLFIHQEEPLLVYVVNNRLLVFQEHIFYDRYFTQAYYFLYEMNKNEKMAQNIPKELKKYLRKELGLEKIVGDPLIGTEEYAWNLTMTIEIQEKKKEPIVLKNIKMKEKEIEGEVRVTGKEGFYLFANITTNALCDWFERILHEEGREKFDKELLKNKTSERIKNIELDAEIKEIMRNAFYFMIEYIDLLKKKIQQREVTVEEIVRLSGARVIAFLAEIEPELIPITEKVNKLSEKEITPNEKLMYYTLIEIYDANINHWKKVSAQAEKFNRIYKEKQLHLQETLEEIEKRRRKEKK